MVINNEKSVLLKDILKQEDVYISNNLKSRQEILKFGSQKIFPYVKDFCSQKVLYEKLKEVDKLNLVLENGLFIPHTKFPELENIYSVLIISPNGIKDERAGLDIYLSFLFLSPLKPAFFQTHLNLLSYITRIFKKELIDILRTVSSPLEAYKIITGIEK